MNHFEKMKINVSTVLWLVGIWSRCFRHPDLLSDRSETEFASDVLNREGTASGIVGPECVIGFSPCYVKRTLNTWPARKVSDFWLNLPRLTHSKALIGLSEYGTKQL